jgi:hypothetical protein
MMRALGQIAKQPFNIAKPELIRIESFQSY